jgi:predicted nuclease of predicted toxin-antitoxin system
VPRLRGRSRAPALGGAGGVRLLFDQNLSHRLVASLASCYPDSVHVRDVGLSAADDQVVWTYAAENGLTIVSKDSDFQQRALLYGHPPKVIWVRLGNCTTAAVATLLQARQEDVQAFEADPTAAFLVLS